MGTVLTVHVPARFRGALVHWAPVALLALFLVVAPSFLSEFRINLLGKFLSLAILAISLDLVWGYAGMLSLGHGVFFGLGGYAFAMFLKLEASRGELPDFMFWSGLRELPIFWAPFAHAWFAILMVFIVPGALAGILGYLVFRSRITGVYFALITQALALLLSILFIGQQPYTGGTNGVTNLKSIFGFSLYSGSTQLALYYVTLGFLTGAYLLCYWITSSRFGRLLVAIRDDENRVRFSGYDPAVIKTLVFVLSAVLAGLAGALFAPQVGIMSPAMMGIVPSIEIAVWVAVGGRGTLIGAAIGAVLVNFAKSSLSESFPDIWTYFLGALFIGAVLLFPSGIMGLIRGEGWHPPRWLTLRQAQGRLSGRIRTVLQGFGGGGTRR